MMRHIKDGVRIAGGQGAAALGALLGVRILTELLPPAAYGQFVLLTGAVALFISVCVNPLAQTILFSYSGAEERREVPLLRAGVERVLARSLPTLLTVSAALGSIAVLAGWVAVIPLLLLCLLAPVEAVRLFCLSIMSAARQHGRYALWTALDAWLRPLAASAIVLMLGATAGAALVGHCAAAALLLAWLGRGVIPDRAHEATAPEVLHGAAALRRYAMPLVPLGLIGWANGLGDRYLIGGMLSLADAGVYAAVYGLASRPMLMISGALELQLRPIYQTAVNAGRTHAARRALRTWALALLSTGLVVTATLALLARPLADLLLGAEYRSQAVTLAPWIAAGYLLQALGQLGERVCYAHGDTRAVLWTQSIAAVTAAASIAAGIALEGLRGAAMAVPLYLGCGAIVAWLFARRSSMLRVTGAVTAAP